MTKNECLEWCRRFIVNSRLHLINCRSVQCNFFCWNGILRHAEYTCVVLLITNNTHTNAWHFYSAKIKIFFCALQTHIANMDIKTNISNQTECSIQDSTVQTMEHRLRHSQILHMNQSYKSHETVEKDVLLVLI